MQTTSASKASESDTGTPKIFPYPAIVKWFESREPTSYEQANVRLASGHLLRVTYFGSLASGHLLPRPAWVRMTIATRANPNIHQLSFPSICTHTDTANQACDTCIVPTRSNFIVVRIVGQYLDMQNSPNSGVTAHWQRDPCCAICVPWNSLPLVLALFYVAVGVAEPSHSAACKIPQNRILPTRV